MIPTSNLVQMEGNLSGEEVQMTLDQNSTAHLMALFTDLYSDPVLAVIREYSTNALDSHVEAGQTRPIEIRLPGLMSPFFEVQDFGVGLNHQGIVDVYSKYGASTKRGTNDQVGMLGLGCKSALSLANQFIIIGVKDGIKTHVIASRQEDGSGKMMTVHVQKTDEPNGVTIRIPADVKNEWKDKTNYFFKFWPEGTVLINGEAPASLKIDKINDQIGVVEAGLTSDYIVMGNIPYPVRKSFFPEVYSWTASTSSIHSRSIVAFVDMGEVDFTPNREELHFTEKTNKKIKSISETYKAEIVKHFQGKLNECENHTVAAQLAQRERGYNVFLRQANVPLTYKGELIPPAILVDASYRLYQHTNSYHTKSKQFEVDFVQGNFILTGWDEEKFPSHQRTKLRRYLEANTSSITTVLFMKEPNEWVAGYPTASWDEIVEWCKDNPIKRQRVKGQPQDKPAYDVLFGQYGGTKSTTEIDQTKAIVYAGPREIKGTEQALVKFFGADCNIYVMAVTRFEKFIKNNPKAMHLRDYMTMNVKKFTKDIPEADKFYLSRYGRDVSFYEKFVDQAHLFDDPEIIKHLKFYKAADRQIKEKIQTLKQLCYKIGVSFVDQVPYTAPELAEKYSLLAYMSIYDRHINKQHIAIYMNAVHAAERENDGV